MCCRKNRLFRREALFLPSEKILSEHVLAPDSTECHNKDNSPEMTIPSL